MHVLVLITFEKYFIRYILCGHIKIITIFPRNIYTIFSKYFVAMWVHIFKICNSIYFSK